MHTITARHLSRGDVLAGSGFVVDSAYVGVRTPKGKIWVVGAYPGGALKRYEWNLNTRLTLIE